MEGGRPPSTIMGMVQQAKGNVEETWGHLTGNEETKHQGAVDIAEGKAEKHMARAVEAGAQSIDQQLKSDISASEALRESAKAAKKLGKLHGDEPLVEDAAQAKEIAKEIREAAEQARSDLRGA